MKSEQSKQIQAARLESPVFAFRKQSRHLFDSICTRYKF
jgi:hypothetical protein